MPLVELLCSGSLHTVLVPLSLEPQNGLYTIHWNVHTHAGKDKQLPRRTQVLQNSHGMLILYIILCYICYSTYFVADGHVSFAHVVYMTKVSPFVPVYQGKTMKPFHSVGGETTMVRHVVLGSICHFLKQGLEGVPLGSTCEVVPSFVLVSLYTVVNTILVVIN